MKLKLFKNNTKKVSTKEKTNSKEKLTLKKNIKIKKSLKNKKVQPIVLIILSLQYSLN